MSAKRLVFLSTLGLFGGVAIAQDVPGELRDLVGARAPGGETQLQARGYSFVRGETGDDRKWGYWWNARSQRCISVATVQGRFDSIITTPAPDCRQRPANDYRPPRPDLPGSARPDADDRGPGQWAGGRRIDLGLICYGEGQKPTLATRYGWTWNERRDRYDYGNRTELTTQEFDAAVMIQVWNGGGRIKLPRKLIPPINSRGAQGWWDMTDVVVDRDTIRGTYRLNGLNKPRVTIDRRSGRVNIQGSFDYAFRGSCDVIDGRDTRKF